MVWSDRKPINFLSTCHDAQKIGRAERRNKDGTVIKINMPQLVSDYNHYIGGTDKNDQMTRLYRTRHHCWPRRLVIKFVMWATYNAYVLFQIISSQKAQGFSFRKFIDKFCLYLVGVFRADAVRKKFQNPNAPGRLQNVGLHLPQIPRMTLQIICVLCAPLNTTNSRTTTQLCHTRTVLPRPSSLLFAVHSVKHTSASKKAAPAGLIGTQKQNSGVKMMIEHPVTRTLSFKLMSLVYNKISAVKLAIPIISEFSPRSSRKRVTIGTGAQG